MKNIPPFYIDNVKYNVTVFQNLGTSYKNLSDEPPDLLFLVVLY